MLNTYQYIIPVNFMKTIFNPQFIVCQFYENHF